MSMLVEFIREIRRLRSRKVKAFSVKRKFSGETVITRRPSGIRLSMLPGPVSRS